MTNTKVTDVVTGPAGFQIVGTEPASTIDGGTVSFDLGTLQPNETRNLDLTIKVPATAKNGQTFSDVVTASGTCDGRPVTQDDRLDNIPVVKTDFTGPCNVQFSNKDASHIQVFPGETFSYYVHAFNSGAQPCNSVTVTDTLDSPRVLRVLPPGLHELGPTRSRGSSSTIPGGSSADLAVVVKVAENATGVLGNSAVIAPANGSPATVRAPARSSARTRSRSVRPRPAATRCPRPVAPSRPVSLPASASGRSPCSPCADVRPSSEPSEHLEPAELAAP